MTLQGDGLAMIGLGVQADHPPNSLQPPLVDGIHLRWGFDRDRGFPWHGFHLFRRPARAGRPLCLSAVTGGLAKGGSPGPRIDTAIGVLSAAGALTLTDDFAPPGPVEFSAAGPLRFDLPDGVVARRVEVRVGFRAQRCLDFAKLPALPAPSPPPPPVRPRPGEPAPRVVVVPPGRNPLVIQSLSFEVKGPDGKPAKSTEVKPVATTTGPLLALGCGYGLTIRLPPANVVDLTLTRTVDAPATVEGFDARNVRVAKAPLRDPVGRSEQVKLTGTGIVRVEVLTARNTAHLHKVCTDTLVVKGTVSTVRVSALSAESAVRVVDLRGEAGSVHAATLLADSISAVTLGPGAASLVELCYVPVEQEASQGWEVVPNFVYPMGLPVTAPAYPCQVANPSTLVGQRVTHPLPVGWDPTAFGEYHTQLVAMVQGGPGGPPMADVAYSAPQPPATASDPQPPALSDFPVLDMILLSALQPGLAELAGLYWVDRTAAPSTAYDYLIVADHTGVGERSATKVLGVIQSTRFTKLDGWIVFDKRVGQAPALPSPTGLQVFELPGGTFPDAQGQLPADNNSAGLHWAVGWDPTGGLLPDQAVMYLPWRASLGNAATPASGGTYNVAATTPILVTEATFPKDSDVQRPADWPAVVPHFIDRRLPDGWYSYQVSGVDLFGRHSPNSPAAQVRLLDRIPPPAPTGVQAQALDPADPYLLQDSAYLDWLGQIQPSLRSTLVGLRVRWSWTLMHQRQAPDTREFRIYLHPVADPPQPRDDQGFWQARYYVVDYDDSMIVEALTHERTYEVFIPASPGQLAGSLPLVPTLEEPVAYGYVGVSAADDKPHTPDARTTGPLANRPGNEGPVGPPATIYVVRRTLPPAPEPVMNDERLLASAADYHSRSYFSFRWKPEAHLGLHVFRALDDAVFKADRASRPTAAPLDASQLAYFPSNWNGATRQAVVTELQSLGTLGGATEAAVSAAYRNLSDKALRVLAGLPGADAVYTQLTIKPLDAAVSKNALGPDDPDGFAVDPNLCVFVDTLDGRSTNRYFYRAALVDKAHNCGPLGLSSPPVYLPKVVAPVPPVVIEIRGGERSIQLRWVRSREPDLGSYRIYRALDRARAADIRRMQRVHTVDESTIADAVVEVTWSDDGVDVGVDYYYRLTALDR